MKNYTSYGKGVKSLSFEVFKKLHKDIERFTYFTDKDWEKEYKLATGKEIEKDIPKETKTKGV